MPDNEVVIIMPEIGSARDSIKDGTWFRDTDGRFVLFRGVNFASRSKLPPYIPVAPLQSKDITLQELKNEIELVRPQIKLLKDLGVNIVRFLVMWKAIEPTPNPNLDQLLSEGENYLNLVKEIIDVLYSYGLFVIIDFHQDIVFKTLTGNSGHPAILEYSPFNEPHQVGFDKWRLITLNCGFLTEDLHLSEA